MDMELDEWIVLAHKDVGGGGGRRRRRRRTKELD
jgi:hypothetical protein